jgi:hypothetical protein
MRNPVRSELVKGFLILVLALTVAQCGSDDDGCTNCGGGGSSEPQCANEDLTAGLYSFDLVPGGVEGCGDLFALLSEFGLIPAGPYPIQLPDYDQLPEDVTVTLPLPGSPQVTGTLSVVSGDITLAVPGTLDMTINFPPFPGLPESVDITMAIGGTLCPDSETRVDTDLAITLTEPVPGFTSGGCTIEASLTGTRQ